MVETAPEMPDKMIETLGDELFELKRARLLACWPGCPTSVAR